MVYNVFFLSKQCLTLFICARRVIHSDIVVVTWLSNIFSSGPELRRDLSLILLEKCLFPTETNEIRGASRSSVGSRKQ